MTPAARRASRQDETILDIPSIPFRVPCTERRGRRRHTRRRSSLPNADIETETARQSKNRAIDSGRRGALSGQGVHRTGSRLGRGDMPETSAKRRREEEQPAKPPAALRAPGGHVVALDGLRGVAILLVMVFHMTVLPGGPLADRLWIGVARSGWCGVDLFFVLSGFLITGILHDSKGAPHYFRNFYARRVLRIFPLYYAVLFVSVAVLPRAPLPFVDQLGSIAGDELWYWTYLSNVAIARHGEFRHQILDISWSLAIEEQYYLLWPLVVFLLPRRALMGLCIALAVACPLVRAGLRLWGVGPVAAYVLTPARLDPLAVGSFIALAVRGGQGFAPLLPWARRIWPLGLAAFASIAVFEPGVSHYTPVMQTAGYSVLAILFGAWLVLAARPAAGRRASRLLEHPVLTTFGRYSYALYLLHLPVRTLVREVYPPGRFFHVFGSRLAALLVFYAITTAISLALAWASWHLLEKRFLALKRRFPLARSGHKPAAAGH
jgi:peptidoglycan/LPS O-acetylase OafA/YrhL